MLTYIVSLFKSCTGELPISQETYIVQDAIDTFSRAPNKKYELFYKLLKVIDEIGYYPDDVSISPTDMLVYLQNYHNVIQKEYNINIAYYHKYFGDNPKSVKMEMMTYCGTFGDKNAIDENGQSFVHHAVKTRQLEFLRCLLETGENPNLKDFQDNTPLFYTLSKKHKDGETVKLLLKYGADPEIKNAQGKTWTEKAQIKRNFINLKIEKIIKN